MNNSTWIKAVYLFLIIIFLMVLSNSIHAQSENQKYYWLNFGLGAGSVGEDGTSLNLNASYQFSSNMLSLRVVTCGDLFGRSLNDYGLLYGKTLSSSKFLTSFGIGLALVDGTISHGLFSGKESEKIDMIIGVPLEVQLFWRPFKFFGVGLYGFANFNGEETFGGATLCLQFGKLR